MSLVLALLIIALLLGIAGAFIKALLWIAAIVLIVDVVYWLVGRARTGGTGI